MNHHIGFVFFQPGFYVHHCGNTITFVDAAYPQLSRAGIYRAKEKWRRKQSKILKAYWTFSLSSSLFCFFSSSSDSRVFFVCIIFAVLHGFTEYMHTKKWSQNILIVHCATSWKWMKHFFILSPSFHCRKWGFPECYKIKGEMCSIGKKNKKKDKNKNTKKCYLAQHHINCREMFIFLIKLVTNDKLQHFLDTVSSRLPQGQMQEICDTLCNSAWQSSTSV